MTFSLQIHPITIDGKETFYQVEGQGSPLLVIPGWTGVQGDLSSHLANLSQHFQLITFVPPGFFDKTPARNGYTVDKYTQYVDEFIKLMGFEKIPILGTSFGGLVALKYASLEDNRAEKVMLLGMPIYFSLRKVNRFLAYLDRMARFLERKSLDRSLFRIIQSKLEPTARCGFEHHFPVLDHFSASGVIELLKIILNFDLRLASKAVKVPVLIIQGDRDFISPIFEGMRLKKLIPNSNLFVVKRTNHANYFCGNSLVNELENAMMNFLDIVNPIPKVQASTQ